MPRLCSSPPPLASPLDEEYMVAAQSAVGEGWPGLRTHSQLNAPWYGTIQICQSHRTCCRPGFHTGPAAGGCVLALSYLASDFLAVKHSYLNIFLKLIYVGWGQGTCVSCAHVRSECTYRSPSSLLSRGSQGLKSDLRLGGRCPYPLSHLSASTVALR